LSNPGIREQFADFGWRRKIKSRSAKASFGYFQLIFFAGTAQWLAMLHVRSHLFNKHWWLPSTGVLTHSASPDRRRT